VGILSWLLGRGVSTAASGIANAVDKFVETPEEKHAAEILRMKILQKPDEWQARINEIEAGHRTLFVAGWRPAIGWICAIALGWGWIVGPTLEFFIPGRKMPAIEVGQAISLVMALLGLAATRTYEKKNNLTN